MEETENVHFAWTLFKLRLHIYEKFKFIIRQTGHILHTLVIKNYYLVVLVTINHISYINRNIVLHI